MKTCRVQASADIELYFYGELSDTERTSMEQHLSTCAACRNTLDELAVIRAALARAPDVAAPAGGDWNRFMTRLDAAIGQERATQEAPVFHAFDIPARSRQYASYVAMAALLVLVTLSVAYVARWRAPQPPQVESLAHHVSPPVANAPERSADAAFASVSEQHFERSKLVVLGLATKDARDISAADWAYERRLASTLLKDTRLYRLTAEERGMTALARVMSDLELVLLEASLSEKADASRLAQIQRLIRKRDLVTKMDVVNISGL